MGWTPGRHGTAALAGGSSSYKCKSLQWSNKVMQNSVLCAVWYAVLISRLSRKVCTDENGVNCAVKVSFVVQGHDQEVHVHWVNEFTPLIFSHLLWAWRSHWDDNDQRNWLRWGDCNLAWVIWVLIRIYLWKEELSSTWTSRSGCSCAHLLGLTQQLGFFFFFATFLCFFSRSFSELLLFFSYWL